MLRNLRIKNFALIDQIELNFESGFSVITGETGSGKSILLNALNLILGERADFSVIGSLSEKSIVEADFLIQGYNLENFFRDNDLDYEESTLIRREININGKSRAFVNDTPVSLTVLKELVSQLINIHSQYNTLELKNKMYQLEVVDLLSDLKADQKNFQAKYKSYLSTKNLLSTQKERLSQLVLQKDYNQFQLDEINGLNLDTRDYLKLESELTKAQNSGEIIQAYSSLLNGLEGENESLERLQHLKSVLDKNKKLDLTIEDFSIRINSVIIELKDLAQEALVLIESVEMDPEKIENLTSLLNAYFHVLKKHNLTDQHQLFEFKENLERETTDFDELQEQIIQLEKTIEKENSELLDLANNLHQSRVSKVPEISKQLKNILTDLKLPDTNLEFKLNIRTDFNQFGLTDVEFLFSANQGISPVPIERAASGGELSRVMLALQKMVSEKKLLPTVLFDEIDTGVSGDVAQKIGDLLNKMGENFQLIAITHLPQVAAKSRHHFKVEKNNLNGRTMSSVRLLSSDEKVNEIARLMSGELISDAAIANAKSLMN